MNYKVVLTDELRDLINGLTAKQKENWRKLIKFMRDVDANYNHGEFSGDSYDDYCALSYAIGAGIIERRTKDNSFSFYEDATDKAFGDGAYEGIFGSGSYAADELEDEDEHDFPDFCYHVLDIQNLVSASSSRVADALETLFGLTPDKTVTKVTVHWKSNQKDNFASVESLREFMDLNPHRKHGYRKITATKMVERVVYEEVTETITL